MNENLIVVSAATTMGIEALKMALITQEWNSRQFVGGAIVFTALAGVGEFAPQPAGMFAALIMVTVLLKDGAPVINKLLGGNQNG
jgi:hypothetical protein